MQAVTVTKYADCPTLSDLGRGKSLGLGRMTPTSQAGVAGKNFQGPGWMSLSDRLARREVWVASGGAGASFAG